MNIIDRKSRKRYEDVFRQLFNAIPYDQFFDPALPSYTHSNAFIASLWVVE